MSPACSRGLPCQSTAMQSGGGVASLLLALALAGSLQAAFGLSVSATAETAAVSWLRAHRGAPQADELAELKDANPEAYGLVKALLMKRSLGLLDPRHPTASFAKAPATTEEVPAGPEAFAKIAAESGEKPKVAPLYADVPAAPEHHSWLNWKPQQSALDDDSMVKDVMGATAEGQSSEDAPASVSPQAVQAAQAPAEGPAAVADAKPQASMNQENSYLKGIDFEIAGRKLEAPPSQPRASVEQNSYLKQFDLGSEQQTRPHAVGLSSLRRSQSSQSSSNALASFSWDDEAPVAKETTAAPAAETKPKPHNALLN